MQSEYSKSNSPLNTLRDQPVPSPSSAIQIDAQELVEVFPKGRDFVLEHLQQELSQLRRYSPGDQDILMYFALRELVAQSCLSWFQQGPDHVVKLAYAWEGALSSLLSLRGSVDGVFSYRPFVRVINELERDPQKAHRFCHILEEVGRIDTSDHDALRQVAMRLLYDVEGRATALESFAELLPIDTGVQAFQKMGTLLRSRLAVGQKAALIFLTRELGGRDSEFSPSDREAVLYFAIRELAERSEEAYQSGDPKALKKCSLLWQNTLSLIKDLKQRKNIVADPEMALERAVTVTIEGHNGYCPGLAQIATTLRGNSQRHALGSLLGLAQAR